MAVSGKDKPTPSADTLPKVANGAGSASTAAPVLVGAEASGVAGGNMDLVDSFLEGVRKNIEASANNPAESPTPSVSRNFKK